MAKESKYIYGPVPSRRLGRSLGVDIVPLKVCTLDCVYCQLGKTSQKSVERRDYVPVKEVLAALGQRLAGGLEADFITVSGSGEPTLNCRLGEIISGIRRVTDIPVAIVTNGTLLHRQDVRSDCSRADVVLPSLDAGDEETFRKMNRPHKDISIEKLIDGLCAFRTEFAGQLWLEVFLVEGLNTSREQVGRIREAIERIRPDKVQLNTAVRPTTEPDLPRLGPERLEQIAIQLGPRAKVMAEFPVHHRRSHVQPEVEDASNAHSGNIRKMEALLSMLKRRPCSLEDICAGLGIPHEEATGYITRFQQRGKVDTCQKGGVTFFKAR